MTLKPERFYGLRLAEECNQRCRICMASGLMEHDRSRKSLAAICREIDDAAKKDYKIIDFFGGEPTTQSFLPKAVRHANRLGMICCLATNGLAFENDRFAKRFFTTCRLDRIRTTLHSTNPRIHDAITQIAGSHKRTVQGLKNILTYLAPHQVHVNVVIGRHNENTLENLVRFIASFRGVGLKFSGLILESRALENAFLAANPQDMQKNLLKALSLCCKLKQNFLTEKMPDCILKGRYESCFIREKSSQFTKIARCRRCVRVHSCIGLEKRGLLIFGVPVFCRPLTRQATAS